MTNFADAFRRGQDAAIVSKQARDEIASVIDSVSTELAQATDGRLELRIVEFSKPEEHPVEEVSASAISLVRRPRKIYEDWIGARNPKAIDASWVKVAKWERSRDGYPCRISYDKLDVNCHDKISLEDAIEELLASSWAGEKFRGLLTRQDKQPESHDSGD